MSSDTLPTPHLPLKGTPVQFSSTTSQSGLWDRISTWASEHKAVVYTVAGVAVVVTGAGVAYYLTDSVSCMAFRSFPDPLCPKICTNSIRPGQQPAKTARPSHRAEKRARARARRRRVRTSQRMPRRDSQENLNQRPHPSKLLMSSLKSMRLPSVTSLPRTGNHLLRS